MSIENKVNDILNNMPGIKKTVKRIYQLGSYALSPKLKKEGNIKKISPDDGKEYFFGYYDKTPWDKTGRYMLSLRVNQTYKSTAPSEPAEIVMFDTQNNNEMSILATTNTWNVQQGAMLQWLERENNTIIYNDFRNNEFCSVILNIETKEEKVISKPVYNVARDGTFALSLDFTRLHRLREGYGYSNKEEKTKNDRIPHSPAIWRVNLLTGESTPLLTYYDFYNFETREDMKGAEHKVNHIMINPEGNRFMVLHRWINGSRKFTRLVTANTDGTDLYNLSDDNMVSHCYWKNSNHILAFAKKHKTGNGYYLMKDCTQEYEHLWPELTSDGHPSYSPNKKRVITDTYPDRSRIAKIYLIDNGEKKVLAKVFAPFKYDNEVRCDLHPRWDNKGEKISFDSVFEGKRGLYVIDLNEEKN